MIRTLLFIFVTTVLSFGLQAQNEPVTPLVSRAAFFDVTPPLREMPVVLPAPKDNSWKAFVIQNKSIDYLKEGGLKEETDPLTTQDFDGDKGTKGPIVNVAGTGNINGVYPPDTDGDVGPDHYFQMINLSFAIYDKQGTKIYGPVANSTLWSGFPGPWSGTNDGDPVILYDQIEDRWIASQFAIYTSNGKYYELVAVSATGDPLGSWYRYAFEFNLFPDYPKMSVWTNAYLCTFHMFSGSFAGHGFAAFEKEKMLTGDPTAQMIYFGQYPSKFGFLPADLDGSDLPPDNAPCIFAGVNTMGNHKFEVWEMNLDWTSPSNSTFTMVADLPTVAFNGNVNGIAQPGTSTQLDALAQMTMFRLPYRNFGTHQSLVANHTVLTGGHAGIRWYEIRNSGTGWQVYQQGTYSPDANNRWMGSIAMAGNGSIAIGFSVSSSTVYPSIRYTGRTPDAPLGTMNISEVEVMAGASSQNGIERWGDYASLNTDPVDDSTFWFTTEYMKSSGWGTRVCSFNFDPLEAPTAYAGSDGVVCSDTLYIITDAEATNYSSLLWTTSGDGQFLNPTNIETKYLRGQGDIQNGTVTLTLTVNGYQSGQTATDDRILDIVEATVANAGPNQNITIGQNAYLTGEATSYSAVLWTTPGDGTFDDPAILNPVYTPGTNDISSGQVNLMLTSYPLAPCNDPDSDVAIMYIGNFTGIEPVQGEGSKMFTVTPNPSNGMFSIGYNGNALKDISVEVLDLTGNSIFNGSYEIRKGTSLDMNLKDIKKGTYIIRISGNDILFHDKLLLN